MFEWSFGHNEQGFEQNEAIWTFFGQDRSILCSIPGDRLISFHSGWSSGRSQVWAARKLENFVFFYFWSGFRLGTWVWRVLTYIGYFSAIFRLNIYLTLDFTSLLRFFSIGEMSSYSASKKLSESSLLLISIVIMI